MRDEHRVNILYLTCKACSLKSGVTSIIMFSPWVRTNTEARSLLSFPNGEVHTLQAASHLGTPFEVPEPNL